MLPGLAHLGSRLRAARSVTVLTGAGISAESGIPTFRDAQTGIWAKFSAEELATPEAFARNPERVWTWYVGRRESVRAAEPNAGHLALVEIERRVSQFTLVTQNVDGLHGRAGHADPVELHGNLLRTRCSREGVLVDAWDDDGTVPPRCPRCSASLRPDVIWFGELLPYESLRRAHAAATACDLFLSVGTSNLVEPAASIPWTAQQSGADVVVINTTAAGQRSGPRIHLLLGRAATVLPALVHEAWPDADAG